MHNPMVGHFGMTMCCIVHNEIFFLEEFVRYYRRLGVDRFIFLDDHSTDGTRAYLAAQPDAMIVGSDIRYFEQVEYDPEMLSRIRETRAVRLWRDQLLNQFCAGQWAVVADPDEFIALPEGMTLPDLAAQLSSRGIEAAWGAMIDMYPRSVSDLLGEEDARFRLDADWFFDARPHLRIRKDRPVPKDVYPGSVARLFAEFDVLPQDGLVRRLRRRLSGYRYAPHSIQYKTPLVFWKPGDYCLNCHQTNKPVSPTHVLPIMHFKFTADLVRKIDYAVSTGGYNQGSRSYKLYRELLDRMSRQNRGFLGSSSQRYESFASFSRAGIATGLAG